MTQKLDLPDVTLVAVFTVEHALTLRAVDDCLRHVNFGDVKLFTDRDVGREHVRAGPFANLNEAGRFTVYELPKYIHTSHALFIHHDSWVIDPGAWTDEFLRYDYVGAVWPWYSHFNVGNSGFCLRSKRLMDHLAANEEKFPIREPEDLTLCREYRWKLQPEFRWAPAELAHRFSVERVQTKQPSFGFHGMFRFPDVLTDDEIEERMKLATPYAVTSAHFREMRAIQHARQMKRSA